MMKKIQWKGTLGLLLAAQVLAVGCGPAQEFHAPSALANQTQEIRIANGLSTNGLSTNGLSTNGLSTNGLSTNGLSTNGVNTADFTTWFQGDPARNDTLMQYVVRCGVRSGQSISYTDPATAHSYTWQGLLGLTPGWAGGASVTEAEQQVMTACLVAHVNKYGMNTPLSVLGRNTQGEELEYSQEELETYSRPEGCFFGNLFTSEGFFVGSDGSLLQDTESSPRACALMSSTTDSACAPVTYVGTCESLCTRTGTQPYYTSCTLNGREYLPITTRLRPEEVYQCGDGVCQWTEQCGGGTTRDSCAADCGICS
ncbi:hypothetical protein D187_006748 [Cystobacter fuscus DSM 2262]|uniref:Gamma-glutamyltranspeptidase n=1 Tax=Cystobacter fuscus (strain ATCC 25194 / DSM 2262 / NBRC 100088 / M29) TaxID=1242864 RepID=S9Q6N9_CYSF2|nr:hypothetical protein [Cystobacter fuscus]EPX56994.1 hypothetical protein D187_006748 [Cystobacter fuscus DSM 2262]